MTLLFSLKHGLEIDNEPIKFSSGIKSEEVNGNSNKTEISD